MDSSTAEIILKLLRQEPSGLPTPQQPTPGEVAVPTALTDPNNPTLSARLGALRKYAPDGFAALKNIQGYDQQMAHLDKERGRAEELRSSAIPQGRQVGDLFVADPFGAMAAGAQRVVGGIKSRQVESEQRALVDQLRKGKAALLHSTTGYGGY